jgi:hypothetical protein
MKVGQNLGKSESAERDGLLGCGTEYEPADVYCGVIIHRKTQANWLVSMNVAISRGETRNLCLEESGWATFAWDPPCPSLGLLQALFPDPVGLISQPWPGRHSLAAD